MPLRLSVQSSANLRYTNHDPSMYDDVKLAWLSRS